MSSSDEDDAELDGIAGILAREGQDTRPLWERILDREGDGRFVLRWVSGLHFGGHVRLRYSRAAQICVAMVHAVFRADAAPPNPARV
jgi:hypothetical protein